MGTRLSRLLRTELTAGDAQPLAPPPADNVAKLLVQSISAPAAHHATVWLLRLAARSWRTSSVQSSKVCEMISWTHSQASHSVTGSRGVWAPPKFQPADRGALDVLHVRLPQRRTSRWVGGGHTPGLWLFALGIHSNTGVVHPRGALSSLFQRLVHGATPLQAQTLLSHTPSPLPAPAPLTVPSSPQPCRRVRRTTASL